MGVVFGVGSGESNSDDYNGKILLVNMCMFKLDDEFTVLEELDSLTENERMCSTYTEL